MLTFERWRQKVSFVVDFSFVLFFFFCLKAEKKDINIVDCAQISRGSITSRNRIRLSVSIW